MKKIYIILLLVLSAAAFKANAQIVLGPLKTNGTGDEYPTHIDDLGKGGFRSVATLAERDLITAERRKTGMLVYVGEDKSFYNLIGTTLDPIDLTTINKTINNNWWVKVALGGGSGSTGGGGIISGGGPPNPTGIPPVPANPQDGDYYLDTTNNILYGPYNSTSTTNVWPQVGAGPLGTSIDFKGTFDNQAAYDLAFPPPAVLNQAYYNTTLAESRIFTTIGWTTFVKDGGGGTGGGSGTIDASAASTNPATGFSGEVFGGPNSSIHDVLKAILYPAASAGVLLTIKNAAVYEVGATGPFVLKWSVTKAASTPQITAITVDGSAGDFSGQSAAGVAGIVEGEKDITATAPNTAAGSKTYGISVTAGKTVTKTADIAFRFRRYWGISAGPIPTEDEIKDATGGNSDLNAGNATPNGISVAAPATGSYIFFAYAELPTNVLTEIALGAIPVTDTFTPTKVNVTKNNISQSYRVYTSQNQFTATTPLIYTK